MPCPDWCLGNTIYRFNGCHKNNPHTTCMCEAAASPYNSCAPCDAEDAAEVAHHVEMARIAEMDRLAHEANIAAVEVLRLAALATARRQANTLLQRALQRVRPNQAAAALAEAVEDIEEAARQATRRIAFQQMMARAAVPQVAEAEPTADQFSCPICLDNLDNAIRVTNGICPHFMCQPCFNGMYNASRTGFPGMQGAEARPPFTCPSCRAAFQNVTFPNGDPAY
jgi:Ring finger domain